VLNAPILLFAATVYSGVIHTNIHFMKILIFRTVLVENPMLILKYVLTVMEILETSMLSAKHVGKIIYNINYVINVSITKNTYIPTRISSK
jgi:hypothetical protein